MRLIKLFTLLTFLIISLNACNNSEDPSPEDVNEAFITTWNVGNNHSITIPINRDYSYDYTVDWGDGTVSNETGDATHTYDTEGTYQVKITGSFPAIYFFRPVGADEIQSIDQWGSIKWQDMKNAFYACSNLTYQATDVPDLSLVTDMEGMFTGAEKFNGDISNWDVSKVTNMSYMFHVANAFNQDISSWDVSNVTDMSWMFNSANAFNQDISSWDVSKVSDMTSMFKQANAFNQNIGGWDVSNVTNMKQMFYDASTFNQDISSWDVSNATNMESDVFRSYCF